ncbi:MAG TPA: hydrogenase small subunit [Myxococcales bacterium]|nr:hydrogenase small subunit [Myxococcales bacterium]
MSHTREDKTLAERLEAKGFGRRDFVRLFSLAAAAVGLPKEALAAVAQVKKRPSVIWLHFQECTGCTETLLRASHPEITEVILEAISLDYHETLFAAAGHQIEEALQTAMKENAGKYICVVEGAIPTKDNGIYCKVAGKTALESLNEVAGNAAAVIALGSCASFGGLPAADPNPTGAKGVPEIFSKKPVVTLPGCPANPYNLLGVVLQYVTFGTLPKLDTLGRPTFAYGRTIHEDCPRRPHFDAGRFAKVFGDQGHRDGYCLYELGCKGPVTYANCSIKHFCDVDGAWPIGIGHPCAGCTEQATLFRTPLYETVQIKRPTPPDQYPPIAVEHPAPSPVAIGFGGAIVGAAIGAGLITAKKLGNGSEPEKKDEKKEA